MTGIRKAMQDFAHQQYHGLFIAYLEFDLDREHVQF